MWYLVVIVVAALVSVALAPKPPEPKPASLSDVDAPPQKKADRFPSCSAPCCCVAPTSSGTAIWKPTDQEEGGKK